MLMATNIPSLLPTSWPGSNSPPTIVFDLLQAINAQMDQYEAQRGTIKVPGNEAPLYPPEDPAQ